MPADKTLLGALLLAISLATGGTATAAQTPGEGLPVREVTLDNGMRLLILPRPGAPTVSFVVQFGVGGVNEKPGTTGIAHLLEHMLFKGTTTIGTRDIEAERALFPVMDAVEDTVLDLEARGDSLRAAELGERLETLEDSARTYVDSNEFDRILTQAGAQGLNAVTTSESTIYYVELPANRAELWFALEADRMSHPVFREFYAERDVVMEERRMRIDTDPGGMLYEAHLRAAFAVHPYGRPVVGTMEDLHRLRRTNVERYYRRYYGPNNAVVAIVGHIDPDRIEAWARRYLAPIPKGDAPPPVTDVEPPQRGERRVVVEWDAEPRLRIGWHVPSGVSDQAAALTVLTSVLAGGRTSRLYKRLVSDDRLATGVYASTGPGSLYPMLLQIDATPRSPHTTEEVETAIYDEISRLVESGPTEAELERVRNQVAAGAVRRIQSNLGLAFQLADSESLVGDWRDTFRSAEGIEAVSAEDVRALAARWLTPENRTVATLVRKAEP